MSVTQHRRLGLAAGAACLALAATTGCSGLGRSALGTIAYETARKRMVQVDSPAVRGCHRLAPAGAVAVTNRTLADIVMYRTTDCTGKDSIYVATTVSDVIAPGAGPWRSYRVVH
ncbi:hypothetical protein [Streptomyces corynorhini]|uniref:Lipoprotein n=1 Tax=Streptomyces corynorhini TaxID=2282652 RepID=A0A370BHC1_9ACTN|nr:hypothetical protein [Streptomyces corynorhini]RDG39193.1 hypothetical protein DVH02_05335 [Streptomyces corynorhini]